MRALLTLLLLAAALYLTGACVRVGCADRKRRQPPKYRQVSHVAVIPQDQKP